MRDFTNELGWEILSKIGYGWEAHDIESVHEMIAMAMQLRGWDDCGIGEFITDIPDGVSGYEIMVAIIDYEDR